MRRGMLLGTCAVAALLAAGGARAEIVTTGSASPPLNVVGNANVSGFIIGSTADGTLLVENGSVLTSITGFGEFGKSLGVTGTGFVTGTGSTLAITGSNSFINIGRAGTGFLELENGGKLSISGGTFPTIQIGGTGANGPGDVGGTGTLVVDGIGSQVLMTGPAPAINVGRNLGRGTLLIENGGTVTGTTFVAVGRGGSVGTMNVTGTDSLLALSGADPTNQQGAFLSVGRDANTAGTVNVLGGGRITIESVGGTAPGMSVGRLGSGVMTIDGAGSRVAIAGDTTVPTASGVPGDPGVSVGRAAAGILNVTGGGTLFVQDTSVTATGGLSIGGSQAQLGVEPAGTGKVHVAGPGSKIEIASQRGRVAVGNTPGAAGELEVVNGGAVDTVTLSVGRMAGGTGKLTVDGAGSAVTARGTALGNPTVSIGEAGQGTATVSGGARLDVIGGFPGLLVGSAAGSDGNLAVSGPGTAVTIAGSAIGGLGSTIGRAGTGVLTVSDSATFRIVDTSPTGTGGLAIGGNQSQVNNGEPAGSGTVILKTNALVDLQTPNGALSVGRNGTGVLKMESGADIMAQGSVFVGRFAGSNGIATIDGAGTTLSVTGNGIVVGQNSTGTLSLTNGASATVTGKIGATGSGLRIGSAVGGTGTVAVDASGLTISGAQNLLQIGAPGGKGTLGIANGGNVSLSSPGGRTEVGAFPGGAGFIKVSGAASSLGAGANLMIGTGGTGTVLVDGGGLVSAGTISVGAGGTLGGTGTILGNIVNNGGVLTPGSSPGTLEIHGNYAQTGGKIVLEIESDGAGGFDTDKIVFDDGAALLFNGVEIEFSFLAGTDATEFAADGLFHLDTFFAENDGTGLDNLGALFANATFDAFATDYEITSFRFDAAQGVLALAVSEPPALGLLGLGLWGLFEWRRRRLASAA